MDYKCYICNKNYKSYQSLWIHNKKFHTIKKENKLQCKYCDKIYKHASSKSRHETQCKNDIKQDTIIEENRELKNEINNLKKDINILKNNMNINCNNTTNNTTNNTLNNINNVYVKYNNINYEKILTEKEISDILDKKLMALETSIKKIHFNPDKEEYNNIYITNLEGKYAHVYNGGDKLIAINKDNFLDELIDNHICEIDKHKENVKNKKTFNKLDELVSSIIDNSPFINGDKKYNNYNEFKKEGLNIILYNETDKDKFTKLHSKERKMKLIEKTI
jgi:hypothetical protein